MKALKIGLLLVLFVAGLFGLMRLRSHNASLRKQAADLGRRNRAIESTRTENERLKALVAQIERVGGDAAQAMHVELERARREVADLEKRAVERAAQVGAKGVAEAQALANNRDPEKGMMRLEHFQNVGRGTPSAAFQTLVWAALKGEDGALTEVLAVGGVAREKAEALLARLPAAARERYPSPAALAALAVTAEMLRGNALQLPGYTLDDPRNATLRIRTGESAKEVGLPMQLGPGGWQMIVPEQAIDAIARRMGEVPESAGKK